MAQFNFTVQGLIILVSLNKSLLLTAIKIKIYVSYKIKPKDNDSSDNQDLFL
jgi:hypothetical protein